MIQTEKEFLAAFRVVRWLERGIKRLEENVHNVDTVAEALWKGRTLATAKNLHINLVEYMDEYDAIHNPDRIGTWGLTFTGRRFWLLSPEPRDIFIIDIAHNLSRMNRYNGGTTGEFGYSVAQHSFLASYLVEPKYQLATLLHDASEAYIGDVISPLKKLLGGRYRAIENGIMDAVAARYGFVYDEETERAVKKADNIMLATEVRDIVPGHILRYEPTEKPMYTKVVPIEPEMAKTMFLLRFAELAIPQIVKHVIH